MVWPAMQLLFLATHEPLRRHGLARLLVQALQHQLATKPALQHKVGAADELRSNWIYPHLSISNLNRQHPPCAVGLGGCSCWVVSSVAARIASCRGTQWLCLREPRTAEICVFSSELKGPGQYMFAHAVGTMLRSNNRHLHACTPCSTVHERGGGSSCGALLAEDGLYTSN